MKEFLDHLSAELATNPKAPHVMTGATAGTAWATGELIDLAVGIAATVIGVVLSSMVVWMQYKGYVDKGEEHRLRTESLLLDNEESKLRIEVLTLEREKLLSDKNRDDLKVVK